MTKRLLIIQGHPDPQGRRFGHALASAYLDGAQSAGHEVKLIELAKLSFPLLRSAQEFYEGPAPKDIQYAQREIHWAHHIVFVFPIWHGHIPALLHAFLEQTFRPGFSVRICDNGKPEKLLTGRTASLMVTMGMPAFIYRWYFGVHSLKNLKRNIFNFSGIRLVKTTLIGRLGFGEVSDKSSHSSGRGFFAQLNAAQRARQIRKVRVLGENGL